MLLLVVDGCLLACSGSERVLLLRVAEAMIVEAGLDTTVPLSLVLTQFSQGCGNACDSSMHWLGCWLGRP